jgi:SAM-dependent methyltransferase
MAHYEQIEYCSMISWKFPDKFKNCKVLDVGSLDINGSNRGWFVDCEYIGLDIGVGKNVDVVCKAHEYDAPDESFDTIISTECFEHDKYLPETLKKIVKLLKLGGLFVFTCATTGRAEHGTEGFTPKESPFTPDYYKNVTEKDVREIIDIDKIFEKYEFNILGTDLRFWGIKCNTNTEK